MQLLLLAILLTITFGSMFAIIWFIEARCSGDMFAIMAAAAFGSMVCLIINVKYSSHESCRGAGLILFYH